MCQERNINQICGGKLQLSLTSLLRVYIVLGIVQTSREGDEYEQKW